MKLFIPTMPRARCTDPWEYLKFTLHSNHHIYSRFTDLFLYANEKDFEVLQPLADAHGFKLIPRIPDHPLNLELPGSHRDWEMNLFLDWVACGDLADGSDFCWLEDDTTLDGSVGDCDFPYKLESLGAGTTFTFCKGEHFPKVKFDLLNHHLSIPIDWALDRVGCKRVRKLAYHKGAYSSNGTAIRSVHNQNGKLTNPKGK
jgi:hypothetical protein